MKSTHSPDTVIQAGFGEMASLHGRACLSLYQPTHRRHPDNQQHPIRFRQLVKAQVETLAALAQDLPPLDPGLAVLGAPGLSRAFRLKRPVTELTERLARRRRETRRARRALARTGTPGFPGPNAA